MKNEEYEFLQSEAYETALKDYVENAGLKQKANLELKLPKLKRHFWGRLNSLEEYSKEQPKFELTPEKRYLLRKQALLNARKPLEETNNVSNSNE